MATRKKTKTTKARLDALKQKMETAVQRGSSINFMKLKDGQNIIRILPEVDDMEFFFTQVGVHYFPTGNKKSNSVYCRNFITDGEQDCPVCELISELYDEGDDGSIELAKQLRTNKRFWMNVIDRSDGKVKVLAAGPQIFSQLHSLISNPDYGDAIFDETESGVDIIIERKSTGSQKWDIAYEVTARRKSTPAAKTEKELDEIFDACVNLSVVEVGMDESKHKEEADGHPIFIIPYDLAEQKMNEYLQLSDDEDDDENDFYTSDDDDDIPFGTDDDDDEEDEEDEPEPEPAKEPRKIMRRRSR